MILRDWVTSTIGWIGLWALMVAVTASAVALLSMAVGALYILVGKIK
jgi:hypothetical protein